MIVLYIILGILAAIAIVALFMSRDMKATREVIINKPLPEVFDFIKQLKNQDLYSKWNTMDPNMKKSYKGEDGTVGFVSAWEGNKQVGQGEQEILAIVEGKSIDSELRFIKPFKSIAKAKMTTEAISDQATKVSWGFEGKMNYPMNFIKLFIKIEEGVGNDFAFGLSRLKDLLEK